MAGAFVVEGETVAVAAHFDEPARMLDPRLPRCLAGTGWPKRGAGGLQRVVRQHVLDVHQQQLLVLLLVMQAELKKPHGVLVEPFRQKPAHRGINVRPVVGDLPNSRPRDQPPLRAGVSEPTVS